MRALLDTCVVSEITRTGGSARVKEEVARLPIDSTFLSAITIGEMARGVKLLRPSKKRKALESMLLRLESAYESRILPIDTDTARIWGELSVNRQRIGRPLPVLDGLIAATAVRYGLHVVTRNVADFEDAGVLVVDPWGGR